MIPNAMPPFDFGLGETADALREQVQRFSAAEVAPIAAAMVCNLLAAALAGTLIPLGLQKFGIDPAVSSTVFLTTVTDVIGFLAFLGLATAFLL